MYLGIDFGTKKVGLALSDDSGALAFPHKVIPNNDSAVMYVGMLVKEKSVGAIVVGDTKTAGGSNNEVTQKLTQFIESLESFSHVPIHLIPEFGTSGAARQEPWGGIPRGEVSRVRSVKEDELHDARAAALILQRFLDSRTK